MGADLIVFDLDGTIVVDPIFYRAIYSETLNRVVAEKRGKMGVEMLDRCRAHYGGKGELALFALNIAFCEWARMLTAASVESLKPHPQLCEKIRRFAGIKVVYTGSPIEMASNVLQRVGFSPDHDFDLIVGWREPELFPTKWTCSPFMFENVLRRFSVAPSAAWAVGDVWDTDLLPARAIGMKTALIGRISDCISQVPDRTFPNIGGFMDMVCSRKYGGNSAEM